MGIGASRMTSIASKQLEDQGINHRSSLERGAPPRISTRPGTTRFGPTPSSSARELRNLSSQRDEFKPSSVGHIHLSIVVLGASGDLAKKKTYPALFALFSKGFLPANFQIVGYARSQLTSESLRARLAEYLQGDPEVVAAFLNNCSYVAGEYDKDDSYATLNKHLLDWEADVVEGELVPAIGRLFYLALPPTVYPQPHPSGEISHRSWVRVILEKPFGHDLDSSEALANDIGAMWPEEQLYRIDHYLGKELVQNMLVLRFANTQFTSWWNRHYISNVQVIFKEPFGTDGRGGYFDQYGIIRDVIQNHLMQVLALLTMEAPVSLHPDDIRDEKVKVLRCIAPVTPKDCITGQYIAGMGKPGYLDDPTVPPHSKTPTFAACRLYIHNDRWEGVPFIVKAGKALNERLAAVRVQFKTPAASIFGNLDHMRNELVIRFQPGEAIYAKMVVKKPGLDMELEMSELDLTYPERYQDIVIPDAYERLILDCMRGDQQHFVRRDELRAAWAIFTPLLHAIEAGKIQPEPYDYGTRGPASVDKFTAESGFVKTDYAWKAHSPKAGDASKGVSAAQVQLAEAALAGAKL